MADEPLQTRRQLIVEILSGGPWGFEELRRELAVPVQLLEQDLRHVERSLRREGKRLAVDPARCPACGFTFEGRAARRFHAPSRCPRCKNERLREPKLSIP